jgi:hypothetical protein
VKNYQIERVNENKVDTRRREEEEEESVVKEEMLDTICDVLSNDRKFGRSLMYVRLKWLTV